MSTFIFSKEPTWTSSINWWTVTLQHNGKIKQDIPKAQDETYCGQWRWRRAGSMMCWSTTTGTAFPALGPHHYSTTFQIGCFWTCNSGFLSTSTPQPLTQVAGISDWLHCWATIRYLTHCLAEIWQGYSVQRMITSASLHGSLTSQDDKFELSSTLPLLSLKSQHITKIKADHLRYILLFIK